jgi:AraC-like DNA-binding protein
MSYHTAFAFRPETSVRRYAGEYPQHTHAHAQVLLGLQGSLQLELNGHSAFVDASCALVVPAGVSHAYCADAPARVVVVDCPPAGRLDRVRKLAIPAPWRRCIADVDADTLLQRLADAPVLLACRRLDIDTLARAVDAALYREWTTGQLAAMCHLSPQRFRARFVELTGTTPLAWLRSRRLDRAERMLLAGVGLETAALQVGYASASALAYALRRDRGVGARGLRSAAAATPRAFLDI